MYLQTRPRDHSSGLSPSFDQEIMGHYVEIPAKGNLAMHTDEIEESLAHNDEMKGIWRTTNNYVDIPFTNENDDVEFYDKDEINEMNYDDEPPTNKASLDDGEHIMSSPILSHHVPNCGMNPMSCLKD
ncbi:hypothetical protein AAG906_031079 [Vitis piasezkii]